MMKLFRLLSFIFISGVCNVKERYYSTWKVTALGKKANATAEGKEELYLDVIIYFTLGIFLYLNTVQIHLKSTVNASQHSPPMLPLALTSLPEILTKNIGIHVWILEFVALPAFNGI